MALGHARTSSNEATRRRSADRGDQKNTAADLLGALGEIYLLRRLYANDPSDPAVGYMREHLFDWRGGAGVKGPDLQWTCRGETYSVDVKTFDCAPRKKLAAINAEKHISLAGCTGYVFVVAPLFATRLMVSRLVPYEDVSEWPERDIGGRGATSKNMQFDKFWMQYGIKGPNPRVSPPSTLAVTEVIEAIEDHASYSELFKLVPGLRQARIEGKLLEREEARQLLSARVARAFGGGTDHTAQA